MTQTWKKKKLGTNCPKNMSTIFSQANITTKRREIGSFAEFNVIKHF